MSRQDMYFTAAGSPPRRASCRLRGSFIRLPALHPSSSLLPSSCLPSFPGVARYTFGKRGNQSERQQYGIRIKPDFLCGFTAAKVAYSMEETFPNVF